MRLDPTPPAARAPVLAPLRGGGGPPYSAIGWQGPALAIGGAVAFSGKAIIVKLAYRHGVDPVTLIMLRMVVALPFFLAMAAWAGRGQPRLTLHEAGAVVVLGFCGYYLASLLDFMGLQYISASLERLIQYLTPTAVVLLSWVVYRQRTRGQQWLAMALGYGGMLLVFGQELRVDGPRVALGAALVFASMLSYAVYLVGSGSWVKRLGALRLAGWATSVACLFCLLHFALLRPWSSLLAVSAPVVWLSLLNGTLCTVLPVWLVMAAIERLGSARTAQYGMVGPISTIALGVAILGEPFTPWMAAGGACVLLGVALLARAR